MIAEAFVPSFGALGVGGIVAFVMGGLFLFDPAVGVLPLSLILPTALTFGAVMFGLAYLALQTRRVRKTGGFDDLVGATGRVSVIDPKSKQGKVEVHGEIWNFKTDQDLKIGDTVRVQKVAENFTLKVGAD
jgi:membrane-bound serine protease (ClpP class)